MFLVKQLLRVAKEFVYLQKSVYKAIQYVCLHHRIFIYDEHVGVEKLCVSGIDAIQWRH